MQQVKENIVESVQAATELAAGTAVRVKDATGLNAEKIKETLQHGVQDSRNFVQNVTQNKEPWSDLLVVLILVVVGSLGLAIGGVLLLSSVVWVPALLGTILVALMIGFSVFTLQLWIQRIGNWIPPSQRSTTKKVD